jgi:hypothetical protein
VNTKRGSENFDELDAKCSFMSKLTIYDCSAIYGLSNNDSSFSEILLPDHATQLGAMIQTFFHNNEASMKSLTLSVQSTASLNLITAFSDTSPSTPWARSNTLGFGFFASYE